MCISQLQVNQKNLTPTWVTVTPHHLKSSSVLGWQHRYAQALSTTFRFCCGDPHIHLCVLLCSLQNRILYPEISSGRWVFWLFPVKIRLLIKNCKFVWINIFWLKHVRMRSGGQQSGRSSNHGEKGEGEEMINSWGSMASSVVLQESQKAQTRICSRAWRKVMHCAKRRIYLVSTALTWALNNC